MSHIVMITTEVRDVAALRSACIQLRLPTPVYAKTQLFNSEATGYCVQLPNWRFPVVCELENGQIAYDNFEGRWGRKQELESLIQNYAIEKAKLEARRAGHTVVERLLEDGSVKLTINVAETV